MTVTVPATVVVAIAVPALALVAILCGWVVALMLMDTSDRYSFLGLLAALLVFVTGLWALAATGVFG